MITVLTVLLLAFILGVTGGVDAQVGKPFILPVTSAPGPGTWLLGQPYGNTVGAFLRGADWYSAGQRLHFGLDLSMPCGTELVAIGDGTVVFVDDLGFGSGPHNLLIRHDTEGLVSLYGHLFERPALNPGDIVTQGQVVARSGDPDVTCDSRPHLHLEIRSLDYFVTYNPLDTIEANWHAIAIAGPFVYPLFQQNLDDARRWIDLFGQPQVAFGGQPLNDYAATFPNLRDGAPPNNPPMPRAAPPPPNGVYSARSTGALGCCAGAFWDANSGLLTAIDGVPDQRATLMQWSAESGIWTGPSGSTPPPYTSPDESHTVTRDDSGLTLITRLADGASWTVDTQGAWPALSTDNQQIMWTITPASDPTVTPITEIWISNSDGTNPHGIAAAEGSYAQWLDEHRLLIGRRDIVTTTLGIYDTRSGEAYGLGQWNWLRGLSVAPGGGRLLFYTVWEAENGLYTIATEPGAQAQKLPWFGGWRWRDENTVYLAPLDAAAATTNLLLADLTTGEVIPVATDVSFLIANGDWAVSSDGLRLALFNVLDETTWILTPAGESQS